MSAKELKYVLITPARNEAQFIEGTIRSVTAQTVPPLRWIIVSDGSTDGTDEIVRRYAAQHPWIQLLRLPERQDRQFAAKALGVNAAYDLLKPLEFDVVGNVDADVSFGADHMEFLLRKFEAASGLGVAGTPYREDDAHSYEETSAHSYTNLNHVSGQCQMFRRRCFEEVGGYLPIQGGAIDWVAVTTARMKGWETRSFPERVFDHHRTMGTADRGLLSARFHYGRKAYYVGGHPLWELLRGFFQMKEKPWILGGLMFQFGYLWSAITRAPRPVSAELIAFHRSEQMARLQQILGFHPKSQGTPSRGRTTSARGDNGI